MALHLGWNVTRFGEQWLINGRWLHEADGFNLIEGDYRTLALAFGVWIAARVAVALAARTGRFGGASGY